MTACTSTSEGPDGFYEILINYPFLRLFHWKCFKKTKTYARHIREVKYPRVEVIPCPSLSNEAVLMCVAPIAHDSMHVNFGMASFHELSKCSFMRYL
jgi:hypothetical protein